MTLRSFRILAVASAILAFVLAVLGSWVRINGAGMTCPDWPLCQGHLIPTLKGGVVLEWSHRAVGLTESALILATIGIGWPLRRKIAGAEPTLVTLGIIVLVQILLGGATVRLSNSPISVMLHWGMGMVLLATLTTLAILTIVAPTPNAASLPTLPSSAPPLALAALAAFIAMCIGAFVSSSYAGLACLTVPACGAKPLFGADFPQHIQMLHRWAAAAFALIAFAAAWNAARHGSGAARSFACLGAALVIVQISLGIANVVGLLPIALREAHAANAVLTFLAFVTATVLTILEAPLPSRAPHP